MSKRVAIQGEEDSFHDIAAVKFFGPNIKRISRESFKDTFAAVQSGQANYAVCAIENSLYGSINETYDLLVRHHFVITGEVYLRIEECLIVIPGTKLKDIDEVHSHPVALAQCEAYLDRVLPTAKRLEFHDTAASVAKIRERGEKRIAAIASREAAKLHGMSVLAAEIETSKQNYTRFIVLEPKAKSKPNGNKTSLIIRTTHKSGALHRALGVFADRSIDLTKLQSRPIIGKAWHYIFYVDVNRGITDPTLIQALDELVKQRCEVKVLGSYPAGAKGISAL